MSDRDPRVDPRVGDVVRKGSVTREVVIFRQTAHGVDGPVVRFFCTFTSSRMSHGRKLVHPMRQKLWTGLETWRKWCGDAEVLQRGQGRADGK